MANAGVGSSREAAPTRISDGATADACQIKWLIVDRLTCSIVAPAGNQNAIILVARGRAPMPQANWQAAEAACFCHVLLCAFGRQSHQKPAVGTRTLACARVPTAPCALPVAPLRPLLRQCPRRRVRLRNRWPLPSGCEAPSEYLLPLIAPYGKAGGASCSQLHWPGICALWNAHFHRRAAARHLPQTHGHT
jgi:hypothetical protein